MCSELDLHGVKFHRHNSTSCQDDDDDDIDSDDDDEGKTAESPSSTVIH